MQIPKYPCHIKELNISCFGCCGNNFSSKKDIEEDIRLNTEELVFFGKILNTKKLKLFRDRFQGDNALSLNGLCYNFVDFGFCQACPLHPQLNLLELNLNIKNKFDLRISHCNIDEECDLFKRWKLILDSEKISFLNWLKNNNYDSYDYSVENGKDILYEKFKSQFNKKNN